MNKLLLISSLIFLAVFCTDVKAQLTASPASSVTSSFVTVRDSDALSLTINLTNNSVKRDTFMWKSSTNSLLSQWDVFEICDPYACLSANLLTSKHQFIMNANAVGIFKVDIYANCTSGNGSIQFLVWNKSDSANTAQTLSFGYNVNSASCTNGLSKLEVDQIKFYPNPVKNKMTLQGLETIDGPSVQVFNLIGSKVIDKKFKYSEAKELSLEGVDKGIYLLKIYSGDQLLTTKKFMKAD